MPRLQQILSLPAAYRLLMSFVGKDCRPIYVRDYLRLKAGERVLDLGCGPGDILAFLPECVSNRIRLSLTSTVVDVRYVGPPCRLAGALRTTLRAADGELLYRGAAARISENVAGRTLLRRALLPDLPRCTSRAPYAVVVVAFGHAAHGSLACRLDFSKQ